MSATPRKARRSRPSLRAWVFEKALAATPYIASIMRSLREHALDIQTLRQQLQSYDEMFGRPDRKILIAQEETRRDLVRKEEEFDAGLNELEALNIQLLDAHRGLALIPFVYDDQQAVYVFDLFETPPIRAWRFESDPEGMRRKLTPAQMH